jgi:acyl carrier protein
MLMNRDELISLICETYREFVPPEQLPEEVNENTRLFGGGSPLDSVALVSLVVEVEQQVNDRCGSSITIADDRAMSQKRSPFRSVGSLGDYVLTLLSERKDH